MLYWKAIAIAILGFSAGTFAQLPKGGGAKVFSHAKMSSDAPPFLQSLRHGFLYFFIIMTRNFD